MGIVNPPEVHPGVLRALYRLYVAQGPAFTATTSEAVSLLAPASAVNAGTDPERSARLSFKEAVAMGMLEAVADSPDRYRLALPAPPQDADASAAEDFFLHELRRLVLAPENNDPLFVEVEAGEDDAERERGEALSTSLAREFTRIQAWVLSRPPTDPPLAFADRDPRRNVQQLQGRYAGRDLVVNGNRWTNFRRWSLFLGFSRQERSANRQGLVPDPTRAVRQELESVADGATELPLVDLRDRLRAILPVLDGGAYREAVNRHIGSAEDARVASPALALTLLRCQRAEMLELTSRADFPGGTLVVDNRPYTHVLLRAA